MGRPGKVVPKFRGFPNKFMGISFSIKLPKFVFEFKGNFSSVKMRTRFCFNVSVEHPDRRLCSTGGDGHQQVIGDCWGESEVEKGAEDRERRGRWADGEGGQRGCD